MFAGNENFFISDPHADHPHNDYFGEIGLFFQCDSGFFSRWQDRVRSAAALRRGLSATALSAAATAGFPA